MSTTNILDLNNRIDELEKNSGGGGDTSVLVNKTDVAPDFSDATNYYKGDLVYYNGVLYEFQFDHTAGAWEQSEVQQKDLSDIINNIPAERITYDNTDSGLTATDVQGAVDELAEEKTDKSDIAPEFDATTAYVKGDLCYHDGALYEFNQAHSAGAWNASHVDNVSLNDMTKTNRDTSLSNITFYRVGNMAIMELNEKNVTLNGGNWVEIETVPTGYIPKYKCYGVGKQFNGDKPISLEISTTGKIFCMGTGTSAVSIVGQLVYVI